MAKWKNSYDTINSMRTQVKFFQKESVIAIALIIGMLLLTLLPDIIKWSQTPVGHTYNPIHNCALDYVLYTNYTKQGLDGQTTLFDRFTTEIHPGALANPFYLFLGNVWRVTQITDPNIVYHVSRITLAIVWAVLLYFFIRRSFPSKSGRLIALFLVLYSASFPIYRFPENIFSITTHMTWWSELNPIVRFGFLPAHLMGHILMLTTLICFTNKKVRPWMAIIGTITGFFAGLFHTPSLMLPLVLLPTWAIGTGNWKRLILLIFCLPLSALSYLILSRQFNSLPWTLAWDFERQSFAISIPEYLLGVGPIVPLGILGSFLAWRQKQGRLWILWASFCILAIASITSITKLPIPFIQRLPITNMRFLQMALPIPLAMLSTYALLFLKKHLQTWMFTTLMAILLFLTLIHIPSSIMMLSKDMFNGPLFQYPTTSWMKAVRSLDDGPMDKAVLSLPFAGTAIAGNTRRTVYIGRVLSTINLYQKTDQAFLLYAGSMPLCTAYDFLSKNRIKELFWGYDEKTAGGNLETYPFIRLKNDFGDTKIYEFTEVKPEECTL